MTPAELLSKVRIRLARKVRQAQQAFINEFVSKKTANCTHKGRQLSDRNYHCKINAMGAHELGASQCWDEKAALCPLFELKRSSEQITRDFRNMSPRELAIRWPAIGELMRMEAWLNQIQEPPAHEPSLRPRHSNRPINSSHSGSETNSGGVLDPPESGQLHQEIPPAGFSEDRQSYPGSPKTSDSIPTRLSMAAVQRSSNGKPQDRETLRSGT
jgi:hypothetical protein